jgi:predicted nucleic acid-binding Zn ribbon protein
MAIHRLNRVLGDLSQEQPWQASHRFQQLLHQWPQLVGEAVATHTRPARLDRQILQVGTATAVWAQNLQFERHHLRRKIHQQLGLPLRDIQFSTVYWAETRTADDRRDSHQQTQIWQQHPCRFLPHPQGASTPHPNPITRCPQCQGPTPQRELERWGVCAFCISQQWHQSHP